MIKKIIIFLVLISASIAYAKGSIDFYTYRYIVKKDDTFHEILSYFLRPDIPVRSWTLLVQETRARNPQIKSWEKLEEGEVINLFLDPDHIAWSELSRAVQLNLHRFPPLPPKQADQVFHYGAFYSASFGDFDEATSDILTKSSTVQNSPVTLGLNFYQNVNNTDNVNGSIYFSTINDVIDENGDIFPIPMEIGVTGYYETTILDKVRPYFGADYENFSVFSAQKFQEDGSSLVKTFSLAFMTVGVSNNINIWRRSFFTKISFSKSFLNIASDDTSSYNGEKLIAFVATPLFGNFSLSTFYKKHFLRGESILSIHRFGIGFGYRFQ